MLNPSEGRNPFAFDPGSAIIFPIENVLMTLKGHSRIMYKAVYKAYLCNAIARAYRVEISDISKTYLKEALKLELDNTAFYNCAMNVAQSVGDDYGYAKFKALKKVENEHAEAISMALQIEEPTLDDISCSNNFEENTQEGWEREDRAIRAYSGFAEKASEPLLKQFFSVLVEIETDHLALHSNDLKKGKT